MRAKGKRKKYQRTLCDNLACKNKKAKNKNKKKKQFTNAHIPIRKIIAKQINF